jgi:hypothetical protein
MIFKKQIEKLLYKMIFWEPAKPVCVKFKNKFSKLLYFLLYPDVSDKKFRRGFRFIKWFSIALILTFLLFYIGNRDEIVYKIRKHMGYRVNKTLFNDSINHELLRSVIYKESGVLIPCSVPFNHVELMYNKCTELNVPVSIFFRLVNTESRFDSTAKSAAGASGYCQIMPSTWDMMAKRLKLTGKNARNNIIISVELLNMLRNEFIGYSERKTWELVLSSYNAGLGRVISSGYKIPPIKETQNYVKQIMGNHNQVR